MIACGLCPGPGGTAVADHALPDAAWVSHRGPLDDPRPTAPLERLVRRWGSNAHIARLLAATPALRGSWLLAIAIVLGFAALAAQSSTDRGLALFLSWPPSSPSSAWPPRSGPASTRRGSSPGRAHRRLPALAPPRGGRSRNHLRRGRRPPRWPCPGGSWTAAAWVLPALGLTLVSLALST